MLREILALVESGDGCVGLREIGLALAIEPSAAEGMVRLLVQRGRLIEVGSGDGPCAACASSGDCTLAAFRQTRFVVAHSQDGIGAHASATARASVRTEAPV